MRKQNHGVHPVKKDHRDYSYPRTFGAIPGAELPDSLNLSAGFPPRAQNKEGFPMGCTGYTQAAICTDEDKSRYDPIYTYDKTLEMMGYSKDSPDWEKVGCDLRQSLSSTIVYGVRPLLGTGDPADYRRGAYYAIEPLAGDWFDSVCQALMTNRRPISAATPWFPEFATLDGNKIIQTPADYDLSRCTYHNWEIVGWETVNGVPYLLFDAWYGDGLRNMPRDIFNRLMTFPGSAAITLAPFTGANVQFVKLTILETLISYLRRMVELMTK